MEQILSRLVVVAVVVLVEIEIIIKAFKVVSISSSMAVVFVVKVPVV